MSKLKSNQALQGFTLVELSIVIVIIGFLVAGIAAGANMVKQAEIRSVITDLQSYQTAYNNFVAKYNAVPGDMSTASSFWTGGACASVDADCNGNGNGIIEAGSAVPGDEIRPALKELALANMISAGITALTDGTFAALSPGTNAPSSKISGAGYFLAQGNNPTAGVATMVDTLTTGFFPSTTNVVFIGKTTTGDNLLNSALIPEDAFSIDQKMDDGTISGGNFIGSITGNIMSFDGVDVSAGNCAALATGYYDIATGSAACVLGLGLN
ncbi:MAG: type II secretion system protein [Rickettsiales bacterium]